MRTYWSSDVCSSDLLNPKIEKLSLLLAFLGFAIFGFSFMFSKEALEITTPFILLAVRFTVAFIILNLLLLTGKFKLHLKGKPRSEERRVGKEGRTRCGRTGVQTCALPIY